MASKVRIEAEDATKEGFDSVKKRAEDLEGQLDETGRAGAELSEKIDPGAAAGALDDVEQQAEETAEAVRDVGRAGEEAAKRADAGITELSVGFLAGKELIDTIANGVAAARGQIEQLAESGDAQAQTLLRSFNRLDASVASFGNRLIVANGDMTLLGRLLERSAQDISSFLDMLSGVSEQERIISQDIAEGRRVIRDLDAEVARQRQANAAAAIEDEEELNRLLELRRSVLERTANNYRDGAITDEELAVLDEQIRKRAELTGGSERLRIQEDERLRIAEGILVVEQRLDELRAEAAAQERERAEARRSEEEDAVKAEKERAEAASRDRAEAARIREDGEKRLAEIQRKRHEDEAAAELDAQERFDEAHQIRLRQINREAQARIEAVDSAADRERIRIENAIERERLAHETKMRQLDAEQKKREQAEQIQQAAAAAAEQAAIDALESQANAGGGAERLRQLQEGRAAAALDDFNATDEALGLAAQAEGGDAAAQRRLDRRRDEVRRQSFRQTTLGVRQGRFGEEDLASAQQELAGDAAASMQAQEGFAESAARAVEMAVKQGASFREALADLEVRVLDAENELEAQASAAQESSRRSRARRPSFRGGV